MRRIPLGWSITAVLLGCGLILFAGGKQGGIEGWKPLNAEIEKSLGLQEMDTPKTVSKETPAEQGPKESNSLTLNQETTAASGGSETVVTPLHEVSKPAAPEVQSQGVDEKSQSSIDTSGIININTADTSGLMELPGIGEKKAQAIIDYRTKNGPFRSAADLVNVKGIGPKMLEKMKAYVSI